MAGIAPNQAIGRCTELIHRLPCVLTKCAQALRWVILFDGLGSEVRNTTVFAAIVSVMLLAVFYWWFRGDLVAVGGYAAAAMLAILSVPVLYRLAGFTLAD